MSLFPSLGKHVSKYWYELGTLVREVAVAKSMLAYNVADKQVCEYYNINVVLAWYKVSHLR